MTSDKFRELRYLLEDMPVEDCKRRWYPPIICRCKRCTALGLVREMEKKVSEANQKVRENSGTSKE
jgi:hypothetical protein